MRKHVFETALASGIPEDRALVLSQVFKNSYFMGCSYPDSVQSESRKFWPKAALDHPLYANSDWSYN